MSSEFASLEFLDLQFDIGDCDAFLNCIVRQAGADEFAYVVTPNVDHMVQLHGKGDAAQSLWPAYRQAFLTICDSRILTHLARLSGLDLPAVPGSDLTARLLERQEVAGMHLHIVGGTQELLSDLERQFPKVRWTQFEPPANVLRNQAAQEAIVKSVVAERADVTLFAFGAPQSEIVCHRILTAGGARGIALCIGASLEFVTGKKQRAPLIWQKLSLEWMFRLLTEPRRLWRRYLVVGPRIFRIWKRWHKTATQG